MAWIIDNKEITCKDDLRGLPATKVWGSILYAATERHNAAWQGISPINETLADCEDWVHGKVYSDFVQRIKERSPDSSYGYFSWLDPEAGDGNGDFSGLASFPVLPLDSIDGITTGTPMADAAWVHIVRLKRAKYLGYSPGERFNNMGSSTDFGLQGRTRILGYWQGAATWEYILNSWAAAKENDSYDEISFYIDSAPAAIGTKDSNDMFLWRNSWLELNIAKSQPIAVDYYLKCNLAASGNDYSPPATDGTFQLQHASPASESTFTFTTGNKWVTPVYPSTPYSGPLLPYIRYVSGYYYNQTLALVVKPVFQYS